MKEVRFNQSWLPHKGRHRYVVLILDFSGLRLHYFHSCTKFSRKVYSITSISRKIQNSIKFEPVFRFRPYLETKLPRPYLQL